MKTASIHHAATRALIGSALMMIPLTSSAQDVFSSVGGTNSFDNGPASPYPLDINVSGIGTNLYDYTVTLSGVSSTAFGGDLSALMVGPQGQNVILFDGNNGGGGHGPVDWTFDLTAVSSLAANGSSPTGTYLPIANDPSQTYPAGAPSGPYGSMNDFIGTDPNGIWSLYLQDTLGAGSQQVAGWSVSLITTPPVDLVSLQQAFRVQDLTPKLTNVTLNGAHHRLLMDSAPGEDGWHMWATGDYADFNEVKATQSVAELGFSKSLYQDTVRLGLGLGSTFADQDAAFGGGSKIDGDFLVLEGNFRIPDSKMIFSTLLYYGDFDAETSRGYLLGGAKSLGETDVESLALRFRLDWKDAYTLNKFSVTPRVSYTYIDTVADAYTETGGASPASFDEQDSKDHELRIGADFDYALNDRTQLRTIVEGVYRENDDDNLSGTAGGGPFSFANEDLNDIWGRLGFEVIHQLNDTTNVHASVFGSTEGDDATLSASIGINTVF